MSTGSAGARVIAISGVSGVVGRNLVRALDRDPGVRRIIGLDRVRPQGLASPRFTFRQADLDDPGAIRVLSDVDVLVHLPAHDRRGHREPASLEIDLARTKALLETAVGAGVGHVVHVSSVSVYGAHPDNDLPLTEASPLRETPQLPCSRRHRELEEWLEQRRRHWSAELTILRPALLLGPDVDDLASRMLAAPRIVTVRGHSPALQFLHVDDLVAAVEHVLDRRLGGIYNVAAEGWLSLDQVLVLARRPVVSVPEEFAFGTGEWMQRMGRQDFPTGVVHHLMHSCVMSPAELIATGWRPRVDNRTAVKQTVDAHRDVVMVGGVRASRAAVRRWLATGVGLVVGVVVLRRRRRRLWRSRH